MAFKRLERITTLKRQLEINQSQLRELTNVRGYGNEITIGIRRKKAELLIKAALIKGELNSLEG